VTEKPSYTRLFGNTSASSRDAEGTLPKECRKWTINGNTRGVQLSSGGRGKRLSPRAHKRKRESCSIGGSGGERGDAVLPERRRGVRLDGKGVRARKSLNSGEKGGRGF